VGGTVETYVPEKVLLRVFNGKTSIPFSSRPKTQKKEVKSEDLREDHS